LSITPPALAKFFLTQMLTRDLFALTNLLVYLLQMHATSRLSSKDFAKELLIYFRCLHMRVVYTTVSFTHSNELVL